MTTPRLIAFYSNERWKPSESLLSAVAGNNIMTLHVPRGNRGRAASLPPRLPAPWKVSFFFFPSENPGRSWRSNRNHPIRTGHDFLHLELPSSSSLLAILESCLQSLSLFLVKSVYHFYGGVFALSAVMGSRASNWQIMLHFWWL